MQGFFYSKELRENDRNCMRMRIPFLIGLVLIQKNISMIATCKFSTKLNEQTSERQTDRHANVDSESDCGLISIIKGASISGPSTCFIYSKGKARYIYVLYFFKNLFIFKEIGL